MSPQLLVERLLLFCERQVTIVVAPFINVAHGAGETIGSCLQLDHPVALQGNSPVMGEAKKVKRARTIIRSVVILPRRRGRTERNEFRLGGMDGQSILAKSFGDDFHHAEGVTMIAKPNHEVVRVADEEGITPQARLHVLIEPEVQHIVQEHIRKYG